MRPAAPQPVLFSPVLLALLLQAGVAVRSGHLCTQPAHRALGIASSVRASPYIYNSQVRGPLLRGGLLVQAAGRRGGKWGWAAGAGSGLRHTSRRASRLPPLPLHKLGTT